MSCGTQYYYEFCLTTYVHNFHVSSPYDLGLNLEPTTTGAGVIIHSVCYTITSHGSASGAYNIDPDALNNSHWYVRLQRTDGGEGKFCLHLDFTCFG